MSMLSHFLTGSPLILPLILWKLDNAKCNVVSCGVGVVGCEWFVVDGGALFIHCSLVHSLQLAKCFQSLQPQAVLVIGDVSLFVSFSALWYTFTHILHYKGRY